MPILVVDCASGHIALNLDRIDQYALRLALRMCPAILDGDICVKLMRDGQWIATANTSPQLAEKITRRESCSRV